MRFILPSFAGVRRQREARIAGRRGAGKLSFTRPRYPEGEMERSMLRLGALSGLAFALLAGQAGAEVVVVTSKQPYWEVGARDKALSQACALGRFNVRKESLYVARFSGPKGAATLNVAKGTGLNLYDPDHRAKPTEDYFFRRQDSTSCEVYVGGRKGGPATAKGGKR
jgi:hypothetical protein